MDDPATNPPSGFDHLAPQVRDVAREILAGLESLLAASGTLADPTNAPTDARDLEATARSLDRACDRLIGLLASDDEPAAAGAFRLLPRLAPLVLPTLLARLEVTPDPVLCGRLMRTLAEIGHVCPRLVIPAFLRAAGRFDSYAVCMTRNQAILRLARRGAAEQAAPAAARDPGAKPTEARSS